ncbi:MAG: DUF1648 domain-containing protein [Coriobacteriia bacterium]|nr:DUF1648 domain-containing protein [Coriobacteriia bacterium]
MESADMQLVMFALIATIPLVGAMMAITPLLQPDGQAFSVSVPETAQSDPGIRVLKQRFVAIIAALTTVLTLAAVAFCLMGSMKAVMALVVAGSLVPLVAGYGLIVRYRRCVQAIKRERGWQAEAQQRVAAIGEGAEDTPRAISLAWNWLYAPVILLTVGVAIAGYPVMPAQIPVHVDFSGAVTDVAVKSPVVAAFPVALELFLAGCFVFSHWTVLRSKKGTEPGNPASSAWAYGMFAHAQTVFLLVGGLVITAVCGLLIELSMIGVLPITGAVAAIVVVAMLIAAGDVILNAVYGQSGSRVFRMQRSDTLLVDDDAYWKLGLFYYNPGDVSLFLPQRSGFGWTVNWARPAVWAVMAGFVVATALLVVLCVAMVD